MNIRMNNTLGCLTAIVILLLIGRLFGFVFTILFSKPVMIIIGLYLVYRFIKRYLDSREKVEPPHYHFESDKEEVVDVDFEEFE